MGAVNCHHGRDAAVRCHCKIFTIACSGMNNSYTFWLQPLHCTAYVAPPYHEVTIRTDPPEGPYLLGSAVILQCSVSPPLPEGVTYRWTDSIPSTYLSSTQPNLTLTIPVHHPSQGHYYCTVYNGSSELGVGSTTISVRSELDT